MIGKREINSMTYNELIAHVWHGRSTNELVSLTEVFTVDALFYMIEHPDWNSFPPGFKDWVRSTVDNVFAEMENA